MIAILQSCTNSVEKDLSIREKPQVTNRSQNVMLRTDNDVRDIALDALNLTGGDKNTRSSAIGIESITPVVASSVTRGASEEDTLFFVANYSNDNGFCVIAADKRVDPLIAITENGDYDSCMESGPEAFVEYMRLAENYVTNDSVLQNSAKKIIPVDLGFPKSKTWTETKTDWKIDIEPRVAVQWGQGPPYGKYCVNKCVGCGPLAVAQILTYFKYPTSFSGTYAEFYSPDGEGLRQHKFSIDWDVVCQHKRSVLGSVDDCSSEAHHQLAQLCRYVGFITNAVYVISPPGTSTYFSDMPNAFNSLGYTTHTYSYTEKAGRHLSDGVILICGEPANQNGKAHIWIMDGCKYYTKTTVIYIQEDGKIPYIAEKYVDDYYMQHFNWGYGGRCNGWFNDKVFALNRGKSYDNSNLRNDLTDDYSYNVRYISVTR